MKKNTHTLQQTINIMVFYHSPPVVNISNYTLNQLLNLKLPAAWNLKIKIMFSQVLHSQCTSFMLTLFTSIRYYFP